MAERPPHHNSSEFDPSLLKVGGEPPSAADLEISGRQRRLWNLFQHTATSLTHLYKCKSKCHQNAEDQETWLAFQSAASTLTSLYRESADILASLETSQTNNPMQCKPNNRVSSTVTSSSDLSSPRTSSTTKTLEQMENATEEDSSNPLLSDFLTCSRYKRSWSPWNDDNNHDDFSGAKRRKFL